ncbi:hypothetical protein J3R83DRAFT_138 [Lanmaoa asiatica]|nr:hypothetical protein J3R83DRAFT_138 [Lanmaoa asiatica]
MTARSQRTYAPTLSCYYDTQSLSKMPIEWTTNNQKAFLEEELAAFKQIGGRNYTKHWSTLYQKWFRRWPERPLALPDVPADANLTPEQAEAVSNAVLNRQKQLRRWMHWHAGAGQNRLANSRTSKIVEELLKPKTRTKKPWELYSKVHYKTRILPELGTGLSIADRSKKIRELWENETPEVKEGIYKMCEEQKQSTTKRKGNDETGEDSNDDDDDETSPLDPATKRRNIQQCGAALLHVLQHLGKQTGWIFTILMGGPDPMDPQGANIITSLHTGKTSGGQDFAEVYPDFDTVVVEAFGEYLAQVFRLQGSGTSIPDADGGKGEEGRQLCDDVGGDANTGIDGKGDVNSDGNGNDDADADDDEVDEGGSGRKDEDLATPNSRSHLATLTPTSSPSLPAMSTASSDCTSLAPGHLAILAPSRDLATPSSKHLATSTVSSDAVPSENPAAFSTSSCLAKSPSNNLASSQHLASPLASALGSNGSVSTPISTPNYSTSACYNPGVLGDPFPVAGSFMDLLNGSNFSVPDSTFGNAWNDPFMSGMGANMQNHPAGSMTNNFNGMGFKPTQHLDAFSNFSFSPFNTFGTADYTVNGGSQGPYNFNGVPTYPTMPTPSLQYVQPGPTSQSTTLPASLPLASAQSLQLPVVAPSPEEPASQPHQPLADVTVQPAPPLPPTEPGVVNTRETLLVDDNEHTSSSGRSKRKPVPSKRAVRDNLIGKENHIPPPTTAGSNKKPAREPGSDKNTPRGAKRNRKQAADSEPADDALSKRK